jgi:N-sulfoglucosamine sulfohydrolase
MKSFFALLLGFAFASASFAAGKPNILLILSDDHSYPHLGCYGNKDIKTPNLDQFAAQGMRFDRAYVACPQCVPSRAAIMTGRSPVAIQMTRFSAPLPRDIKTYPEALKAAGWFTGVCGRTYHLDGAPTSEESRAIIAKYKLASFPDRLDYVRPSNQAKAFDELQEFLDLAKGKPWFLQLCFNDPHRPLDKSSYSDAYDQAKLTLPAHYPDTKLVRDDFARYYGEITRADELFGKIMAELQKRGFADNTLIAFMGDNGCSQFRGKGTLYEFGIHVPLLARWPGVIKPGSTSAELISGEDLAPTFLEAAGVPVPAEMTGKSFLKNLRGDAFTGRSYVFSERGSHGSGLPGNSANFDLGRVVVSKTHKLVYHGIPSIPYHPVDFAGDAFWKEIVQQHTDGKLSPKLDQLYFAPTRPLFELFDLKNDPNEFNNLAGKPEASAVEKDLKAALQEWMILQRDFLPLPVTPEAKGGGDSKAGKGKGGKKRAN